MAKRKLKPWHYQVTTVLASVTLLVVIAFFTQTFRSFFLTDHDPVLVAVERLKEKSRKVRVNEEAPQNGGGTTERQTVDPEQTDEINSRK
jgi:hypothetical protein